jgi:hypothetical protein
MILGGGPMYQSNSEYYAYSWEGSYAYLEV